MVNKCVVFGCKSGYLSCQEKNVSTFSFPLEKPKLLRNWIKFVKRENWTPTKYSVICIKHFENKFIFPGKGKRKKLKWNLNPVPTIYFKKAAEKPSNLPELPTPSSIRKPLTVKMFQNDEALKFLKSDIISSFNELSTSRSPLGFQTHKNENCIIYFNLVYDEVTHFPAIKEAIKVDRELRVHLQYNGHVVPLPSWLGKRSNGRLTRYSMLQNLSGYLRKKNEEFSNSILDELQPKQ